MLIIYIHSTSYYCRFYEDLEHRIGAASPRSKLGKTLQDSELHAVVSILTSRRLDRVVDVTTAISLRTGAAHVQFLHHTTRFSSILNVLFVDERNTHARDRYEYLKWTELDNFSLSLDTFRPKDTDVVYKCLSFRGGVFDILNEPI